MKKKNVMAMAAALLMFSLSGCGAAGEDVEQTQIIRVAFNQPETHAEYIALADFGEKFQKATNGRYEVQIYPNAVLGDQGPVTEMIRTGALQLAVVPVSVPESYNEDFAIIAAPYLYDNLEQMEIAAREGIFDPLFTTTDVGSKDFGEKGADSFGQGQSAMVIQWGHFYNTLNTTWSDIDFGVFEIPTFDSEPCDVQRIWNIYDEAAYCIFAGRDSGSSPD